MRGSDEQRGSRKLTRRAGIGLFVLLLWTPFAAMLAGFKVYRDSGENRWPTRFPDFPESIEQIPGWRDRFETAFGERFGFRNALVRLHNDLVVHVFGDAGTVPVVIGRDGWLFLRAEPSLANHTRALTPWTRAELDLLTERFLARRRYLAERGIRYLVVVAPAKSTIYPEFFDPRFSRLDRPSRLEQFRDHVSHVPELPFLDPTAALLREKGRLAAVAPLVHLYWRNDTHWNERAGALVSNEIRRALRAGGAAVPAPTNTADSAWVAEPRRNPGDLAKMLGVDPEVPDENWRIAGTQWRFGMSFEPLDAPRRSYVIRDPNATSRTRLLVLHDSFAELLRSFLAHGHAESCFHWTPEFDLDRVADFRPDVVVREITERFFVGQKKLRNPVALRTLAPSQLGSQLREVGAARFRGLRSAVGIELVGVEWRRHPENYEARLVVRAETDVTLDTTWELRTRSSRNVWSEISEEPLCPLRSRVAAGTVWEQRILLDSDSSKALESLRLELVTAQGAGVPLANGAGESIPVLVLPADDARPVDGR